VKTILPGGAIGLLGGGENSLMLALAAIRMGYRVHVFSPDADPVFRLAEVVVQAPYEDLDRVRQFAANAGVVTIAGSNVPMLAVQAAASGSVVHPSADAFAKIESGIGVKRNAYEPAIAEFSILGVRGSPDGDHAAFASYPPLSIDKIEGVFDTAQLAAPIRSRLARQAASQTRDILEDLNLTGVACVDFALTQAQELLVHDVFPNLQRAGHLTTEACLAGQFEQHLRAICGLPLGSTDLLRPAAIANIPETAWEDGEPNWVGALAWPNVRLSLYPGRPGERRGHLSASAASATLARQTVRAARTALVQK